VPIRASSQPPSTPLNPRYSSIARNRNADITLRNRYAPPHLTKGDKIRSNCKLTADLRAVPSSQFVSKVDKDGEA
jgi:hypothetical protein